MMKIWAHFVRGNDQTNIGEMEIFPKIGDFPVPEPEIFAILLSFRGSGTSDFFWFENIGSSIGT